MILFCLTPDCDVIIWMVWFGNVFLKKNISKKADVGLVGYIYLSNANFTTDNKKEWLKKKNFKKKKQHLLCHWSNSHPTRKSAINQPGSQLRDEHTAICEHYILSHSAEAEGKFLGCEVPRLKCTGGH